MSSTIFLTTKAIGLSDVDIQYQTGKQKNVWIHYYDIFRFAMKCTATTLRPSTTVILHNKGTDPHLPFQRVSKFLPISIPWRCVVGPRCSKSANNAKIWPGRVQTGGRRFARPSSSTARQTRGTYTTRKPVQQFSLWALWSNALCPLTYASLAF